MLPGLEKHLNQGFDTSTTGRSEAEKRCICFTQRDHTDASQLASKPLKFQYESGFFVSVHIAAKLAFGEILSGQTLNSQQISFMDTIINFLTVKGVIEPAMLFEPPFTDINTSGIMGMFDEVTSTKIISLLEQINHSAEAA